MRMKRLAATGLALCFPALALAQTASDCGIARFIGGGRYR